ncbi:MAG: hypothetical protein RIC06_09285 [Cyclobacteriaceae bacterium]
MRSIVLSLIWVISSACCPNQQKPEKEFLPGNRQTRQDSTEPGVVYFSLDHGQNWVNASKGLPQKVTIGLGGVSVSRDWLGLVTKEYGVYVYDFKDSLWLNIPADSAMLASNIAAMAFHNKGIFVGSQHGGVFYSDDQGESWTERNAGLGNLTIRRFAEIHARLYVGTNHGLYVYNDATTRWELEYGQPAMQVNGMTGSSNGNLYIATNLGAFVSKRNINGWEKIIDGLSLHNIGSVGQTIYALTYNELFVSTDGGTTWESAQQGLPKELYTFNLVGHKSLVFAGQWDGIYKKSIFENSWRYSGDGLPPKFTATNLTAYNDLLVVTTSERGLRKGMTIEK